MPLIGARTGALTGMGFNPELLSRLSNREELSLRERSLAGELLERRKSEADRFFELRREENLSAREAAARGDVRILVRFEQQERQAGLQALREREEAMRLLARREFRREMLLRERAKEFAATEARISRLRLPPRTRFEVLPGRRLVIGSREMQFLESISRIRQGVLARYKLPGSAQRRSFRRLVA